VARRAAAVRHGACRSTNLPGLGVGPPRPFSYHEADAAAEALAALFIELGLVPGDNIAVQLPNLALTPLTLLAAWRAGLTVAALPMLWREHEIGMVCEAVAPKALVGVSRFDGERYAERLCAIAANEPSVRFVLGFGPDLPDGVASLDDALTARHSGPRYPGASAGRGPAMITFTARAGTPLLPVIRREEELLAQGAMTVLVLALDRKDVILNSYPFTGIIGLSLGLMLWLISGATLVQHHPFDDAAFVEQLLDTGRDPHGASLACPRPACQGRGAAAPILPLAAARNGMARSRNRRAAARLRRRRAAPVRCLSARRSG
jgi:non-ribosomal peptide synthetase component E (peptide arylation enzyme)